MATESAQNSQSRSRCAAAHYELKPEDYCFGKRIVDEKGKLTSAFKKGPKKGLDLAVPTADALGPGGSYNPVSSFGCRSFNKKGSFGAHPRNSFKKTMLDSTVQPHEVTEYTTPASHNEWLQPKLNRKGSWGVARAPLKKTVVHDGVHVNTEFTSGVPSFFGEAKERAPSFGRPVLTPRRERSVGAGSNGAGTPGRAGSPAASRTPRREGSTSASAIGRPSVARPERGVGTEFTTPVYSSFRIAPKSRAKTPPPSSCRPTFKHIQALGEFTSSVPTTFKPPPEHRVPKPVRPKGHRADWLPVPKDPVPGPGQYVVV